MCKIYAISNQKGGVAKTTLKFNFPQNKRGVSRIVMYKVKVSGGLSMSNIDIMTVDPSTLVDIQNVKIDINMPKEERIADFIRQMGGNPYFYRHGENIVKISFADTDLTFDEIYESILMNL